MTADFTIAALPFRIETDWDVELTDNFRPFLTPGAVWEERLHLTCAEHLPMPEQPDWRYHVAETVTDSGEPCFLHRLSEGSLPYMAEILHSSHDREFRYRREAHELPLSMQKVFSNIELETLFLRHGILLLHSSFIRYRGQGILFSAPSGTGKSTQASLWEQYRGAEILNGDRAALRKYNGIWTAFGLPYAGSSDIFRAEQAAVEALVMLAQGKENVLVPLTPPQALRRVLPEVTLHRWDEDFMNRGLDILLDFLGHVRTYALTCRPDRESVELLNDTLTRKE